MLRALSAMVHNMVLWFNFFEAKSGSVQMSEWEVPLTVLARLL